jgi:hypothetical protein
VRRFPIDSFIFQWTLGGMFGSFQKSPLLLKQPVFNQKYLRHVVALDCLRLGRIQPAELSTTQKKM